MKNCVAQARGDSLETAESSIGGVRLRDELYEPLGLGAVAPQPVQLGAPGVQVAVAALVAVVALGEAASLRLAAPRTASVTLPARGPAAAALPSLRLTEVFDGAPERAGVRSPRAGGGSVSSALAGEAGRGATPPTRANPEARRDTPAAPTRGAGAPSASGALLQDPVEPLAPVAAGAPAEKPPAPKPRPARGTPEPLIIDVQQALAALKAQDPPAERR